MKMLPKRPSMTGPGKRLQASLRPRTAQLKTARNWWSKKWLLVVIVIAVVCVAAVGVAGGIKVAADAAAREYIRDVETQRGQITRELDAIGDIAKQTETPKAETSKQLLERIRALNSLLQTQADSSGRLGTVLWGETLSREYRQATAVDFAAYARSLAAQVGRLENFGTYQQSLHGAFANRALFEPVQDQKSAEQRRAAWQEAAEKLDKIETGDDQMLQAAHTKIQRHTSDIADYLGTLASAYGEQNQAVLAEGEAELEKRLSALRSDSTLLQKAEHALRTELQTEAKNFL